MLTKNRSVNVTANILMKIDDLMLSCSYYRDKICNIRANSVVTNSQLNYQKLSFIKYSVTSIFFLKVSKYSIFSLNMEISSCFFRSRDFQRKWLWSWEVVSLAFHIILKLLEWSKNMGGNFSLNWHNAYEKKK